MQSRIAVPPLTTASHHSDIGEAKSTCWTGFPPICPSSPCSQARPHAPTAAKLQHSIDATYLLYDGLVLSISRITADKAFRLVQIST